LPDSLKARALAKAGYQFSIHIREVEAIVQVVRCFEIRTFIMSARRSIQFGHRVINTSSCWPTGFFAETTRTVTEATAAGDKTAKIESAIIEDSSRTSTSESGHPAELLWKKSIARGFFLLTRTNDFACNVAESDLAAIFQGRFVESTTDIQSC